MPVEHYRKWLSDSPQMVSKVDFPSRDLSYAFVGKGKNTMYLRLKHIMARDCFEHMRATGMEYKNYISFMYEAWNKEMPADPEESIAQMPSFSGEFYNMLMKQNCSKNLIIDLCGNDGGFTPITLPTLYQLWCDRFIEQ